jgi:CubicO group peptidase (beta-lactamase class C family)
MLSRREALGLALAGAVGLPKSALSSDTETAAARTIDRLAKEAIRNRESPGLQIALARAEQTIFARSYGVASIEFDAPLHSTTPLRIASLTKQFTCAALLRLQQEGKLSLDDRLAKYYPRFPRADEVTLGRMANHTSGIHNYLKSPTMLADVMVRRDADALAEFFAAMPVVYDFAPGENWEYSNSAYILLGGVLEKASGQSLADVFRTRFFDPLGMVHTAVDDERLIVRGRASGYDKTDAGFDNAGFVSVIATGAAGSLRSTAEDLIKWNRALFGGKVLSSESLKAMLEPGRLANGERASASANASYGYGLALSEVSGRRKISHTGGIHGFTSSLSYFPDGQLTVVLLSNVAGGNLKALVQQIELAAL